MLGVFKKTFDGLEKTRKKVSNVFSSLSKKSYLDENDLDLLEESLYQSDVSVSVIDEILNDLKGKDSSSMSWRDRAKSKLISRISINTNVENIKNVIVMVGINGSGKTTSAAKLAKYYIDRGEKVCLVAADTYRAAAIRQLEIWSQKLGVRLVCNHDTTDPASIAYDGVESAISRKERVIIDTAGRLHTSTNLMKELGKINRVLRKLTSEITTIMVIDGNIGKNSLSQIKHFNEYLNIDGIVITKLDGTARGGVVITAISEFSIPVYFIGIGEGSEDLIPFQTESYIDSILGKDD